MGGSASRIICRSNSNTIVIFVKVIVIISLLVVAQLVIAILFLLIVELIVMVGGASTPALRCCQLNHVKTKLIRSKSNRALLLAHTLSPKGEGTCCSQVLDARYVCARST